MTPTLVDRAVSLAARLQRRAMELQTPAERRQQAELDRMLQTPSDKATLVELTDRAFRSRSAARVADQFTHVLDVQGIPRFFNPLDRAMLRGFQRFGDWLPRISVPLVKKQLRRETANVVLPAEPARLASHLRERRGEGLRMNVNFLGEAILSEAEASRRLDLVLEAIARPETEVFSVKASTLDPQLSPLAREHTLARLGDRLEVLYLAASRARFVRADGSSVPKFIYLDMEEYRDLALTCEAFTRALDRPGLESVGAGIVLQAYLPDSNHWQLELLDWARRRVAAGGAGITIRIVKGANLEMERHEASVKGWPQAPFERKLDTDANYKRLLHTALQPESLAAARLGVASHNLFEVAYALVLAQERGALDRVQFEMLEGMANHQRRALFELVPELLLYAPVCRREHFLHAVGYLVRRLDENTGPDNFLRHAFRLEPGSAEWRSLESDFRDSFERLATLSETPRRTQDRAAAPVPPPAPDHWSRFTNEADTDWSLPRHAVWAGEILESWRERFTEVPLVVAGRERRDGAARDCLDPSRPGRVIGRWHLAADAHIDEAIACAAADPAGWRSRGEAERRRVLRQVAQELRSARADLMGAALAHTGKILAESDPEVSEAVDFVEFYAASARAFFDLPGVATSGKGSVVVVSPWNFPIAIPCGGIAAALAAGNTAILKPASDAVLPAWLLCQAFWRGGVPRSALQFLPCSGGDGGARLVRDPRVDAVILTGGTATALAMLEAKPDLPLSAETGGKNATLVTAMADRDLAIRNVLHSAFSHGGQKCSATSLLLLEAEVYDDPSFRRALVEAAESLPVGPAWEPQHRVGPLIRPPSGELKRALTTLEPGESWALQPRQVEGNPSLWTPGIKWDVAPGGFTHLTEFFGPLLGVMRFETLAEAIARVNETGYGLTGAIESLDEREREQGKAGLRVGNLYLNRGTTGAVVLRQPFGGMGKSAFGPGLKAGGPNYLVPFLRFDEDPSARADADFDSLTGAYGEAWNAEFAREHEHFHLLGQQNRRRYLPIGNLVLRIHPDDSAFEIAARAAAAQVASGRCQLSLPPGFDSRRIADLVRAIPDPSLREESDATLAARLAGEGVERLRYAAPDRVPELIRRAAARACASVIDAPVLARGRIELLWYLREQSLSFDCHRYGNLGACGEGCGAETAPAHGNPPPSPHP